MESKKIIKYTASELYSFLTMNLEGLENTDIHDNYSLYLFYKEEVNKFQFFVDLYESQKLEVGEEFFIEMIETLH